MATKTGYIGLGNMGMPIAQNVLAAGYDLMVYDIRDEPMQRLAALGAKCADSPREVGEHAEIIELSVVDDAQVEEVVAGHDGILDGARPGTMVVVHSTIHPGTVKRIAEIARRRGVGILDACLSGGSSGAQARTLCYMVGGEPALFERCRPLFETSGTHIFHVGDLGMGAATKLAQQVIICLNRLSAYEGMRLAEKAGVNLEALRAIVHLTSAQSQVADNWEQHRRVGGSDSERGYALAHLFWKGLCPALELGHELGLAMPATALVQQLFPKVLGVEE